MPRLPGRHFPSTRSVPVPQSGSTPMAPVLSALGLIVPLLTGPQEVNAVVTANNQFALDLYQQLRTKPGNLFFSPYSITKALAMTYAGARGETADEMAKVLHFTL